MGGGGNGSDSDNGGGSSNNRHVQFQNDALVGTVSDGIPLVISSKKKTIQPRNRDQRQQSAASLHSDYSAISNAQRSGDSGSGSQQQLSPKSQATGNTGATPLTFMSGDMSANDSLSHYLRSIEDEISGDVGQEVELVAHAPVLEHHNHRQIAQQQRAANKYSRSTPPRHHPRSSSGSQKSGSSRRRKRRSGNHIPSNSGKVQVDWSGSTPEAPASDAGGIVCGAGGALAPARNIFVGVGAAPPVTSSPSMPPCGDEAASASCGVILPSPLQSSNPAQSRYPTTSEMAPPLTPNANVAPMSPVHSLDLEKMSLCGTENVSQTGGSIGGASLCNVFDDGSMVGTGALMDGTMSIGSHPTSNSSGPSVTGGQAMGLQPMPLGLHQPQADFGVGEGDDPYVQTLMDMSVGSGSANIDRGSQGSKTSSSSRSKSSRGSRSGRESPASVHKASLQGGKMEVDGQQCGDDVREQPPPPGGIVPMYAHDFKFTWDGKRE